MHSIHQHHLSGNQVSSIVNPSHQKATRNHNADYIHQLKHVQRQNRVRKERERYESEKKSFKMKRFQDVPSKVAQIKKSTSRESEKENRQQDANERQDTFKDSNERPVFMPSSKVPESKPLYLGQSSVPKSTARRTTKPDVPKHYELNELKPREEKNFINKNAKEAITTRSGKPASAQSTSTAEETNPKHKSYGKVPTYIQKRRQQWEDEEERVRQEAAKRKDCPPGMVVMSDDERQETLRILMENKKKIDEQLMKFPIVCDTMGLKKRKAMVESKLAEVEEAIRLFSRPKVFVAE